MTLVPGPAVHDWVLRTVFVPLLLLHAVFRTQEPDVPGMTDLASHHFSLAWYLNGMQSDLVPCFLVGPSCSEGAVDGIWAQYGLNVLTFFTAASSKGHTNPPPLVQRVGRCAWSQGTACPW